MADFNNNKYLEFDEFMSLAINESNAKNDKFLKAAFDYFDEDKGGSISFEEI